MSNNWDRVRLRIETVKEMAPSTAIERTISTHILDTSLGRAAANIPVKLYRLNSNDSHSQQQQQQWQLIGETTATTNSDGRINSLLATQAEFISGIYKLHFDVKSYFEAEQRKTFYPFIEIVIECTQGEHYHVPLLLNPFGHSTYRGT